MLRESRIIFLVLLIAVTPGCLFFNNTTTPEQNLQTEQEISAGAAEDLWYKNSVIYNLDVKVFKDSDGDGIGDFRGLINRLGYIDSLGVTAIWLAPFQPSPLRDDGYDVRGYFGVDERVGSMKDFRDFIEKAGELEIRVLMDLVVNHTSNEHPWFRNSRSAKDSYYRDWYIWSEEQPENQNRGMVFPGVQEEIWTYDSIAEEYYFHRFYRFQPGLNNHNPDVHAEVKKIIKFWMDRGIKGFRLDAVPFMLEIPEKEGEMFEHDYTLLHDIREYMNQLDEEAILLGEANVEPEDSKDFLGEGEGLHMMFNFFVNQRIFYALASSETGPLKDALLRTREKSPEAEWAQFLRNHDEVDLDRLTDEQIEQVYKEFGPEEHMQLYDRGIRRRLAPMLNNNRQHLELAYSVLFSLPSSPVLRYGSEIGMGDDLRLKERFAVRTPMQWNDNRNAGFTQNDTAIRPVIDFGEFSYENINVQKAKQDPGSLLNWMIDMIALRKDLPEISHGQWEILDTGSNEALAIKYSWNQKELLIVHNFSRDSLKINLDEAILEGKNLEDLKGSENFTPAGNKNVLEIKGYGSKWFRIED